MSAPASASASAMAFPMPRLAPVTKAVRPESVLMRRTLSPPKYSCESHVVAGLTGTKTISRESESRNPTHEPEAARLRRLNLEKSEAHPWKAGGFRIQVQGEMAPVRRSHLKPQF